MKRAPDPGHLFVPSGRAAELMEQHFGIRDHPGYFGAFTRRTEPGYLPSGSRVRKAKEDPGGDLTPLGTLGTVLGSFEHPEVGGGYFVEWDCAPARASFCARAKVEAAP